MFVASKSDVKRMYKDAVGYSKMMTDEELSKPMYGRLVDWARKCPQGKPIVDAGCGTGDVFYRIAKDFEDHPPFVGVDLAEGMLEVAKKRCPAATYHTGAITDLSMCESESIGGLLSTFVIHHLSQAGLGLALKEFHRVLGQGGCLALYTWTSDNDDPIEYPDNMKYMNSVQWSKPTLIAALKAHGFAEPTSVIQETEESMGMDMLQWLFLVALVGVATGSSRLSALRGELQVARDVLVPFSYALGIFFTLHLFRELSFATVAKAANWAVRHFYLLKHNHLRSWFFMAFLNYLLDAWVTCDPGDSKSIAVVPCARLINVTTFYWPMLALVAIYVDVRVSGILLLGVPANLFALSWAGVPLFEDVGPVHMTMGMVTVTAIGFQLARAQRNRHRSLRTVFGRYVSPAIVDVLLSDPDRTLAIGGSKQHVAILLSDLRGFSTLMNKCSAEEAIEMMNKYLETMIDVVDQHGGVVDEIIGDALLVVFGLRTDPSDEIDLDPNVAAQAVQCAVDMQKAMSKHPSLSMGIGPVVVGNIGSSIRCKYGIIGNPMNMAARIEPYSVGGDILVSDDLLACLDPDTLASRWKLADRRNVKPKGAPESGLWISRIVHKEEPEDPVFPVKGTDRPQLTVYAVQGPAKDRTKSESVTLVAFSTSKLFVMSSRIHVGSGAAVLEENDDVVFRLFGHECTGKVTTAPDPRPIVTTVIPITIASITITITYMDPEVKSSLLKLK